jgi:hypothetical protein
MYGLLRCQPDKYIRSLSNKIYFNREFVYNNYQIRNEVILKIYYFYVNQQSNLRKLIIIIQKLMKSERGEIYRNQIKKEREQCDEVELNLKF